MSRVARGQVTPETAGSAHAVLFHQIISRTSRQPLAGAGEISSNPSHKRQSSNPASDPISIDNIQNLGTHVLVDDLHFINHEGRADYSGSGCFHLLQKS